MGGFFLGIVFRDWQMSDDADRAEEKIEALIEDGIAAVRRKPSLIPSGHCFVNVVNKPSNLPAETSSANNN